jgi:hypothetical protein
MKCNRGHITRHRRLVAAVSHASESKQDALQATDATDSTLASTTISSSSVSPSSSTSTSTSSSLALAAEAASSASSSSSSSSSSSLASALSPSNSVLSSTPWFDFVDPCSGHPTLGARGNTIYNEVDTAQVPYLNACHGWQTLHSFLRTSYVASPVFSSFPAPLLRSQSLALSRVGPAGLQNTAGRVLRGGFSPALAHRVLPGDHRHHRAAPTRPQVRRRDAAPRGGGGDRDWHRRPAGQVRPKRAVKRQQRKRASRC